jgi:DNA-binding XRE family transcriptional regulator
MDFNKTTIGSEKKTRFVAAQRLSQYKANMSQGMSQRDAAKVIGTPRETLRYWENRTANIPLPQSTVNFFESPDGILFLEQLVNVLQFVMTQVGSCGIRLVSLVLQMSSLDYFVASSYETLREHGIKMEELIVAFGKEEQSSLAKSRTC